MQAIMRTVPSCWVRCRLREPTQNLFKDCPAGRAPCAGGGHFVTFAELRAVLPMVGTEFWLATIGSTTRSFKKACERPGRTRLHLYVTPITDSCIPRR
jgi:hypothetical protein